jgi:hypothetical protein
VHFKERRIVTCFSLLSHPTILTLALVGVYILWIAGVEKPSMGV